MVNIYNLKSKLTTFVQKSDISTGILLHPDMTLDGIYFYIGHLDLIISRS